MKFIIALIVIFISFFQRQIYAEILFEEINEKHRQKLEDFFNKDYCLIDMAFRNDKLVYVLEKNRYTQKVNSNFFIKIFSSEKEFLDGISYFLKKSFLPQAISYHKIYGFVVFFYENKNEKSLKTFEIQKIPFDKENTFSSEAYIRIMKKKIVEKKIPTANLFYQNYIYQIFRSQDDFFSVANQLSFSLGLYQNAKEMHQDLKQMQLLNRRLVSFEIDFSERLFLIYLFNGGK